MTIDPFEALKAANPVPDAAGLTLPERDIAGEVVHALDARSARRRRRAWTVPLVAAAVLGSAAAAYIATRHPTHTASVGCYSAASLKADTAVVNRDGTSPVEACTRAWEEGAVGPGPVPHLAACVLPSGAIGVFPAKDESICSRLGSAVATPPSTEPTAPRSAGTPDVAGLGDALAERSSQQSCLAPDEARRFVADQLQAHRLPDWRIDDVGGPDSYTGQRPCVTFSIDEPARKVLLVPSPPR